MSRVIFVDIDGTICHYNGENIKSAGVNAIDYTTAIPYYDRIEKINALYDKGNTVVYWTSRGSRSGLNWFQLTLEQLQQWGVKFTELRLGKPHYDIFIDDKNINSEDYFSNSNECI